LKKNHHQDLLERIQKNSGKATQHTFLNSYLGNDHPRYPIRIPVLRKIAKKWMYENRDLSAKNFGSLLTSLAKGESSTEKCMVGILLDYSTAEQRKFDPALFDKWLDHLVGWAEVDAVCTGNYTVTEIPQQWKVWKPLLIKLSASKNINKRRASLVLLCSPLRKIHDDRLVTQALKTVEKLKLENEILITKAISWVLRSMVNHYRKELTAYLKENSDTLPKIAVRETRVKLETGVKTRRVHDQ
jgi:3-methyladenine DNA glycosylase AlkD